MISKKCHFFFAITQLSSEADQNKIIGDITGMPRSGTSKRYISQSENSIVPWSSHHAAIRRIAMTRGERRADGKWCDVTDDERWEELSGGACATRAHCRPMTSGLWRHCNDQADSLRRLWVGRTRKKTFFSLCEPMDWLINHLVSLQLMTG